MYKNIYGVQKIPEQDVRSDLDMAVGISSKAATYGKIGNKILPGGGGAIAGATIGAAAGYVQQEGARKEEGIQRKIDQNKNKFIANLSGRSQRQQFYSPIQGGTMVSEKGKKGQYGVNEELVNVEDGELIVNKANGKYNLVKEIKGKKHKIDKEGNFTEGEYEHVKEEESIIRADQKSKFISLLNRQNLGDSNATKQMDKLISKLPTAEETKKEQGIPVAKKGKNGNEEDEYTDSEGDTMVVVNGYKYKKIANPYIKNESVYIPAPGKKDPNAEIGPDGFINKTMFEQLKDPNYLPDLKKYADNDDVRNKFFEDQAKAKSSYKPVTKNKKIVDKKEVNQVNTNPQPIQDRLPYQNNYELPMSKDILSYREEMNDYDDEMDLSAEEELDLLEAENDGYNFGKNQYELPNSKSILGLEEQEIKNQGGVKSPYLNYQENSDKLVQSMNLDPEKTKEFLTQNKDLFDEAIQTGDYSKVQGEANKLGLDQESILNLVDMTMSGGNNVTGSRNSKNPIGYNTTSNFQGTKDRLYGIEKEEENSTFVKEKKEETNSFEDFDDEEEEDDFFYDEPEPEETNEETNEASDDYDYMNIEDRSSPLRYTNVLNNLSMGSSPLDKVTRRFYNPEELKYQDLSHAQRRAITENRNYQGSMMRGKGLSAGQQQGYSSQLGSRFLGGMEQINEREAQREADFSIRNIGARNQAQLQNIGFANQYDMFDDQAEAVRENYKGEAMKELADLSESETRDLYKRDKDVRDFYIQNKSLPLTSTNAYFINPDDWSSGFNNNTKKVNNSTKKVNNTGFNGGSAFLRKRKGKKYNFGTDKFHINNF